MRDISWLEWSSFARSWSERRPRLWPDPSDKEARNAVNGDVLLSEYPPRALAAGEQGLVGFKVTLDRDGYATGCEVTHSSGHKMLDQETCELILNRATFKGIKDGDGRKVSSVTKA